MPVHIDHIDSEIEILPSSGEERSRPRAPLTATGTSVPSRDHMRRAVASALEEELQEYLRIRG